MQWAGQQEQTDETVSRLTFGLALSTVVVLVLAPVLYLVVAKVSAIGQTT